MISRLAGHFGILVVVASLVGCLGGPELGPVDETELALSEDAASASGPPTYTQLTLLASSHRDITQVRRADWKAGPINIFWYEAGTASGDWYLIDQVTSSGANGGTGVASVPGAGGVGVRWQ